MPAMAGHPKPEVTAFWPVFSEGGMGMQDAWQTCKVVSELPAPESVAALIATS